jgi:superfamily II DNA or RNA helicase
MKMYEVAYPTKHRYKSVDSEPYINAIAVDYTSNRNYNIRTTEYGSKNYSHHVYERSIMRNTKMKNDYYTMIVDILYKGFETDYLAGEKAVVFVYSLNMAADLANHLARVYPKLKVMRYVAEDSYDEMLTADIIVSTPQNLGTGIDLPELKMVLLTVNIDSIQSNTQILGRLRNRKGKPTRFYYIYNTSILKHREYHKRRKDLLLAKCKTYSEMAYGKIIG